VEHERQAVVDYMEQWQAASPYKRVSHQ
jgi:hypothetical protein